MHVVGNMKLELNVLRDHHMTHSSFKQKSQKRGRSSVNKQQQQHNNVTTINRLPILSPDSSLPLPVPPLRRIIPTNISTASTTSSYSKPVTLIKWMFNRNQRHNDKPTKQPLSQQQPITIFPSPTSTANNLSINIPLPNNENASYASLLSSTQHRQPLPPPFRVACHICKQFSSTAISSSVGRIYSLPDVVVQLRVYEQNEQRKLESGKYNNNYDEQPYYEQQPPANQNNINSLQRKTSSNIRLPSILSRSSSLRRHVMQGERQQRLVESYYTSIHLLNLDRLLLVDSPRPSLLGFIQQQHIVFTYSFYPRHQNKQENVNNDNSKQTLSQQQQQRQQPCVGPNIARMDYYRFHPDQTLHISRQFLDQSLGMTIIHMSQQSKKICRDWVEQSRRDDLSNKQKKTRGRSSAIIMNLHDITSNDINDDEGEGDVSEDQYNILDNEEKDGGCDLSMTEHTLCFAHGPSRVYINTDTTTTMILPNIATKTPLAGAILMWSVCSTCHAETKPKSMTYDTFSYSFAKYLEFLLYYDDINSTPYLSGFTIGSAQHSDTCITYQQAPYSIIHCFYYDKCTLRIQRELHPTKYALCSPNLPMTSAAAAATTVNNNNSNTANKITEGDGGDTNQLVSHEIDNFFTAIIQHLDLIGHYLKGEAKQQQLSVCSKSNIEAQQSELKMLQRTAHNGYSNWMLYVAEDNNDLNEIRRAFAVQAKSIINQLNEWQRDQCPELIAECAWDIPDYFR